MPHPSRLDPSGQGYKQPLRLGLWGMLLLSLLLGKQALAQSIQPATDGTGTQVQVQGDRYRITGGSRSRDRTNLFHSFERFGLTADEIAIFQSQADIRNILARVVGGDPSHLDGLLRVIGGNANLFLINPAGIIFGEHARLDLPGSFMATTATGIGFDTGLFNTVGDNNYAALVGDPQSFTVAVEQPGAIANFGNLRVARGDLTLLAGTVLNGGTLTAPNGNLSLVAVPGSSRVRLSQSGNLLSLELEALASNTLALQPLSLPALLTGGDIPQASQIAVGADGTVRLRGSGLVTAGDVVLTRSPQTASLQAATASVVAADDLLLANTQVQTTGDLTLVAGDRVQVRDSAANPVRAIAAGNLVIRGNNQVDIFALNHPNSGFFSGGDLTLRSANTISGDAHFYSGGNFRIRQLDGQMGNLFSPYDPVIRSQGNVSFNTYTGASLHIIAAGSVVVPGAITIIGADATTGLQESITLSDGSRLLINGRLRPTLDIRAGVRASSAGSGTVGTPLPIGLGSTATPTSANISIGSIVTDAPNSLVFLSTQYQPNRTLPGGTIRLGSGGILTDALVGAAGDVVIDSRAGVSIAGNLDTSTPNRISGDIRVLAQDTVTINGDLLTSGNNAGDVTVQSRGTIQLDGSINAQSLASAGSRVVVASQQGLTIAGAVVATAVGGTGGQIELQSQRDLQVGNLNSSASGGGFAGGRIQLESQSGNLQAGTITTSGAADRNGALTLLAGGSLRTGAVQATSGGTATGRLVSLTASGDIDVASITTTSGGTGGPVRLNSRGGSVRVGNITTTGGTEAGSQTLRARNTIETGNLTSSATDQGGDIRLTTRFGAISTRAGDITTTGAIAAGAVSLNAGSSLTAGAILTNSGGSSSSSSSQSGRIVLQANGPITLLEPISTLNPDGAAADIDVRAGGDLVVTSTLASGGASRSGAITLESGGNLDSLGEITSVSSSGGANGGQIQIAATGAIALQNVVSGADSGTEEAGDISIQAGGDVTTGNLDALASQQGGDIVVMAGGDILTGTLDTSSSNGPAGPMYLTSDTNILTGDLLATGTEGGTVQLIATDMIQTDRIITQGLTGNGGDVTLDPQGDVQVELIDTQGGETGAGGQVTVVTGNFFRATSGTTASDGSLVSINTAGGLGGGSISITHGGAAQTVPFQVGDARVNGTAGSITSGVEAIAPPQSFNGNYIQGNIAILSETPTDEVFYDEVDEDEEEDGDDASEDVALDVDSSESFNEGDYDTLEQEFASSFEDYFGLQPAELSSFQDARIVLSQVEQAAGLRPALLYVSFVPTTVNQGASDADQLELVLVTSSGEPIRRRIGGATRSQVLATANRFRNEVTNPIRTTTTTYLPPAQQLYQWIIAPLEEELQAQGIHNLAFILDEGLRSLPIAALHDGQHFLVEQYSVGLMPSLSLVDTGYRNIRNHQVLAMGASEFADQDPLPAVPIELHEIADMLWEGEFFLNQDFTLRNFLQQRREQPYGIVHLATHGEFQPGDPSHSYIQLWDQRLRLDQLRQMDLNNPPVTLLVLSACRMALGDRQAELGFAGFALQAGVQTAMASLWYVSDAGTLALMTEFYRDLQDAPIKAEALRQAQLAMIHGEIRLSGSTLISRGQTTISIPDELAKAVSPNFAHPYYWAGFTMIGSPW